MKYSFSLLLAATVFLLPNIGYSSGPDGSKAEDNSVEAEQASLRVHPDFEVSLFADETLGIANPIALQWDHRGRAWVLCTLAYSQLRPGEIPNDKIIILEDTDGDGKADKSTVFIDGLDMTTGFALGHGGVYFSEGPDFVFARDSDGDDKADEKKVILSGFGTGDTHQNISNFVWDSGGFLYFSQGLHTDSQVETPWGVVRGVKAGFWRFDPRSTRLSPFCFPGMMSQNPCGIALDRWGSLFVKSNGPDLVYSTPGMIPTTHFKNLASVASVGVTPGKSMAGHVIENAHQPKWLQNNVVIAGYFSRRVTALPLVEDDSGFAKVKPTELIYGEHVSFRPVDIQAGPDGAIYVVDWFNPIINHYQVSLRHPDRDYEHGRIWRLTAKGKPLTNAPKLDGLSLEKLPGFLTSKDKWTRDRVERLLADAPREKVVPVIRRWIEMLGADDDHALMEAAGVLESHSAITPDILEKLASSSEPKTRAVAARIVGRSHPLPENAMSILKKLAHDPLPRPRLESVIACAAIPTAESFQIALGVLDSKMDRFIDYSLSQTVHALKPYWLPGMESGRLKFAKPEYLAFTLEAFGGGEAAKIARKTLETDIPPATRDRLLAVLAKVGNAIDAQNILNQDHRDAALLNTLIANWNLRHVKPKAPFVPRLKELLASSDRGIKIAAVRLGGFWGAAELAPAIEKLALNTDTDSSLRAPALTSLAQLRGKALTEPLQQLITAADTVPAIRHAAITALVKIDIAAAATAAAQPLAQASGGDMASLLLPPILTNSAGGEILAVALEKENLKKEQAQYIATALSRSGRLDLKLSGLLNQAQGLTNMAPEYDAAFVQRLAAEVRASGDSAKGKEVFLLPQATCIACHKVEGVAAAIGILGPDLTTVGAGLPTDVIIDSILWPKRQLKEGYISISITTKDNQVFTGYEDRIEDGVLFLRDAATQKIIPIKESNIAKKEEIGTIMPPGLTNSLSREQLRNLVAYLVSLKGSAPPLKTVK